MLEPFIHAPLTPERFPESIVETKPACYNITSYASPVNICHMLYFPVDIFGGRLQAVQPDVAQWVAPRVIAKRQALRKTCMLIR